MTRPLSPAEMFPAGHDDITVRFVTLVTQTRVRILESGFSGDIDVVMLHGWVASAYSFRHELESLPALGVHCLAVDLRGFGLSDKPSARDSYALDAYVADLDALLDEVASTRVVLMAHSMGAGIALAYALARPDRVRGLVLVSPVGIVPVAFLSLPRLMPRAIAARVEGLLVPRWEAGWILRHIAYGDPSRATERDVDEYWAPTQLPGFTLAARASAEEFDWRPLGASQLERLAVPSLVILGRKDRLIRDAGAAASQIPRAAVHELDAGHVAHEECPGETHQLVASFLNQVRRIG
ncbi:MAG TPA: alpha/beta hydrolase [Gemmatimonadaceae bacterium]|nr:alpha/beta hydrolase [Gemmatimonadaceae bacterium]